MHEGFPVVISNHKHSQCFVTFIITYYKAFDNEK